MGGRTSQAEWNVDAAFLSWIWNDGPTAVTVHALDWHKCMQKAELVTSELVPDKFDKWRRDHLA